MPEDHHHHLICLECDKVEDVELANDLNEIEKRILQKNGFKIINHTLEFYGLCKQCSSSLKTSKKISEKYDQKNIKNKASAS